jgi:hypothetical protein
MITIKNWRKKIKLLFKLRKRIKISKIVDTNLNTNTNTNTNGDQKIDLKTKLKTINIINKIEINKKQGNCIDIIGIKDETGKIKTTPFFCLLPNLKQYFLEKDTTNIEEQKIKLYINDNKEECEAFEMIIKKNYEIPIFKNSFHIHNKLISNEDLEITLKVLRYLNKEEEINEEKNNYNKIDLIMKKKKLVDDISFIIDEEEEKRKNNLIHNIKDQIHKLSLIKKDNLITKRFNKNLIPHNEIIKPLPFFMNSIPNLKMGENKISFRINKIEICNCKFFIWNHTDKIIVSDIGKYNY